jgi:hypothetical protein
MESGTIHHDRVALQALINIYNHHVVSKNPSDFLTLQKQRKSAYARAMPHDVMLLF